MKRIWLPMATFIVVLMVLAGIFINWIYHNKIMLPTETIHYDPQLTIYMEGGCNAVVLTSKDGIKAVIVDTKMAEGAQNLRKMVKAKEITIINTHFHMDHIGGNRLYTNENIIAGDYTPEQWNTEIIKMGGYPNRFVKRGEEIIIPIDDEKVHVRNMGLAHSWSDVIVYFEKRKLLATGDIVFNKLHPVLPPGGSCSVISWINVLNDLEKRYNIKTLVPGHGALSDKKALNDMKEYFVSIGDSSGDPDRQKELKARYKDYFSMPVIMNFDSTLKFIENEKRRK